jgi:hypothetical protein
MQIISILFYLISGTKPGYVDDEPLNELDK